MLQDRRSHAGHRCAKEFQNATPGRGFEMVCAPRFARMVASAQTFIVRFSDECPGMSWTVIGETPTSMRRLANVP